MASLASHTHAPRIYSSLTSRSYLHRYDYTNKRQRLDRDDGTTKMYDYKTLVDPWDPTRAATTGSR